MAKNPNRVRLVKFNTSRTFSKNRKAVRQALDKVAAEMQAKLLDKISTQGPPRSSPGNPPHKDSGNLHGIHTTVRRKGNGIVVRTVQYGLWLEKGTLGPPRGGAKSIIKKLLKSGKPSKAKVKPRKAIVGMAARPWIKNTIEGDGEGAIAWVERVAVLTKKFNALAKSGL